MLESASGGEGLKKSKKKVKKKSKKKKLGGGVPSPIRTRHPPPRADTPPGPDTPGPDPLGSRHPLDQTPSQTRHPPRPDTPWTRHTPLDQAPPCGQTDACENITLATTSLRLVKTPSELLVDHMEDDRNADNRTSYLSTKSKIKRYRLCLPDGL